MLPLSPIEGKSWNLSKLVADTDVTEGLYPNVYAKWNKFVFYWAVSKNVSCNWVSV